MKKVVLFGLVMVLIFCMVGCQVKDIVDVKSSEVQEVISGNTIKVDDFKISYKNSKEWTKYDKYFAPEDGYKIIRAYFIIENIGDKERYIGRSSFKCYADGYTTESYSHGDDELDGFTSLSAGRKMEGYVYYIVPADAKNIEIEYCSAFNDKAIFKVKI